VQSKPLSQERQHNRTNYYTAVNKENSNRPNRPKVQPNSREKAHLRINEKVQIIARFVVPSQESVAFASRLDSVDYQMC